MSIAGFSKRPFDFTPKCIEDKNDPPVFTLRRLSRLEVSEVVMECGGGDESFEVDAEEDNTSSNSKNTNKEKRKIKFNYGMLHQQIQVSIVTLRKSISGWKSVFDEDGEEIPFDIENIDCLDEEIIDELFDAARGGLKKKDVKNSEPLSKSKKS